MRFLLILLLSSMAAAAQPVQLAITNALAASSTNTFNVEWQTADVSMVSLQVALELQGAGATTVTFAVQQSIDRTNWHSAASLALTASGTSRVGYLTNLAIGAMPWMRLSTAINANTSAVHNLSFWVSRKPGF